jgi:hypothetical protein
MNLESKVVTGRHAGWARASANAFRDQGCRVASTSNLPPYETIKHIIEP